MLKIKFYPDSDKKEYVEVLKNIKTFGVIIKRKFYQ